MTLLVLLASLAVLEYLLRHQPASDKRPPGTRSEPIEAKEATKDLRNLGLALEQAGRGATPAATPPVKALATEDGPPEPRS